ncbi:3-[(3aS,4S,7aS)-7a-methyl-1,5-dioxo-octahydro-1H-inden-4-yl]propanoyl:CoA ligase-like [Mercenaria mercenaria]|uniref:3-[(3aS,4S,7aS)-7a-methyl-1, 5-dioxo-octahydro-1H-inden-4-yl]propanoyl:CoA ligase-like n=1 Tax=Mercenaria mercenaria TaxID=6596 RepID=UPI00234EEF0C|nr:3-[(3aS,4S,7aS)-7a-methyl-1,5-dioxo-octahydro-1H-inden-4-yl]propanoyl:CoA ligase-like [Mercenaria mercenaria]
MDNPLSYENAPTSREYKYKTYMQMVAHWAQLYPNKEAFVEYDANAKRHSITCQELLEKSKSFGRYVASIGIQKGDVVAFCMENTLNMLIAMFGVQFAGGIPFSTLQARADGTDVIDAIRVVNIRMVLEHLTPFDLLTTSKKLTNAGQFKKSLLIRDQNSKLLVMDAKQGEQSWHLLENIQSSQRCVSLLDVIYNNNALELIHLNFKEKESRVVSLTNTPEVTLPDIYPEDLVVYYKSSGSTGEPKLIGHTHLGFPGSTYLLKDCFEIDSHSRYFCDRPLGWSGGAPNIFIAFGATRVIVDSSLSIQKNNIDFLSDIIYQEKCTHVYLPGYLVSDLLRSRGNETKFSTVKVINFGSERFSKRFTELLGRFCKKLVIYYGLAESAEISAFSSHNPVEYEDGIIGKPLPGMEMKVVDEHGNVVPRGQVGELHVRSVYRFIEYKDMREKFLDTVDKGNWLHTGDMAHIRADGNFILRGRISERMSVGTVKIFSQEIEKILINCSEVEAVVVVPVPDERLHHAICACIVLSKIKRVVVKDMHTYFDHLWADFAYIKPKYYIAFEEFPGNANGKIDRKKIAMIAASQLNLC